MGAHWKSLGYESVDALVAEARASVEGQIGLMIRFIVDAGLVEALDTRDWPAFARRYNGPMYRRNRYDEKLGAAWDTCRARLEGSGGRSGMAVARHPVPAIGPAARGPTVRDLQRALAALGYPLVVDGAFGPATRGKLIAFQRDNGLAADGIAGPATMRAIRARLPPAGPSAARMTTILRWLGRILALARPFVRLRRHR